MTQKEKLLQKFIKNPEAIKYLDLKQILSEIGFEEIKAKGSHVKWKYAGLNNDLIFPIHNKDCKGFYKKQALKFIMENNLLN